MGIESVLAIGAVSAGLDAGDDDPIAYLEAAHGRTELRDGSDAFVAQNPAVLDGRHIALEDVQVRSADVVVSTRTITSVGCMISGSGTSCQDFLPGPP